MSLDHSDFPPPVLLRFSSCTTLKDPSVQFCCPSTPPMPNIHDPRGDAVTHPLSRLPPTPPQPQPQLPGRGGNTIPLPLIFSEDCGPKLQSDIPTIIPTIVIRWQSRVGLAPTRIAVRNIFSCQCCCNLSLHLRTNIRKICPPSVRKKSMKQTEYYHWTYLHFVL